MPDIRLPFALALALALALPSCSTPAETETDAAREDAASVDARVGVDAGTDALVAVDAGSDAFANDAASDDVGSDAASDDAGSDAASDDAGSDAGSDDAASDDAGSDAGPPLPATCTTSVECGAHASCNTSLTPGRCVCQNGYAPCTSGCCPVSLTREVTLSENGHAPELGFDAAGNVYVLYLVGSSQVHLATIAPDDSVTVVPVATTSGERDAHDLVVAPDGTVYAAIHVDLGSRSGDLVLHTRAPGATSFTTMGLTTSARPGFAYDAAIGLSRAAGGDLYGALTQRSGDGTMGMYVARFDHTLGVWSALPTILSYSGFAGSELFARDDGFFIGANDLTYATKYWSFDAAGGTPAYVSGTTGTVYRLGDYAAAMTDADVLWTYTTGRVDTSDGRPSELLTFPSGIGGARSDLDMAIDRYGQPVFVTHSITSHAIGFMVRMQDGGYAQGALSPESIFLPFPMTSDWMSLDAERTQAGDLGIAIGDSMDRGSFVYREYAY